MNTWGWIAAACLTAYFTKLVGYLWQRHHQARAAQAATIPHRESTMSGDRGYVSPGTVAESGTLPASDPAVAMVVNEGTGSDSRPRRLGLSDVLTISLLASLTASNAFTSGRTLVIDSRLLALAAAVIALKLKAPFIVVVIIGALVAALGRWAGLP